MKTFEIPLIIRFCHFYLALALTHNNSENPHKPEPKMDHTGRTGKKPTTNATSWCSGIPRSGTIIRVVLKKGRIMLQPISMYYY